MTENEAREIGAQYAESNDWIGFSITAVRRFPKGSWNIPVDMLGDMWVIEVEIPDEEGATPAAPLLLIDDETGNVSLFDTL